MWEVSFFFSHCFFYESISKITRILASVYVYFLLLLHCFSLLANISFASFVFFCECVCVCVFFFASLAKIFFPRKAANQTNPSQIDAPAFYHRTLSTGESPPSCPFPKAPKTNSPPPQCYVTRVRGRGGSPIKRKHASGMVPKFRHRYFASTTPGVSGAS